MGPRNLIALAAVSVVVLWGAHPALAGPSDLDPSFGSGGRVVRQYGVGGSGFAAVARQADGKIVAAGYAYDAAGHEQTLVARYLPSGILDSTFGSLGTVIAQLGSGRGEFLPGSLYDAVAIAPDGRIILGGFASDTTEFHPLRAVVTRLNSNGSLDTTFASGGVQLLADGAGDPPSAWIRSVAVQPSDNRIVFAGEATDRSGKNADFAGRLNVNGTVDRHVVFQDGSGPAASDRPHSWFFHVAVQADGRLLFSGFSSDAVARDQTLLVRLRADFTADLTFGGGTAEAQLGRGPSPESTLYAFDLLGDGRIVGTGTATDSRGVTASLLARFNANGTLDAGFSVGGTTVKQFGSDGGRGSGTVALALQSDGSIVPVGVAWTDSTRYSQLLARYDANGSLDIGFAPNGFLLTSLGETSGLASVVLQPDGRIVVAGLSSDASGRTETVVARYGTAPGFPSSRVLPPLATILFRSQAMRIGSGRAGFIRQKCPPKARRGCRGKDVVSLVPPSTKPADGSPRPAAVRIGSGKFSIAPGRTERTRIRLSKAAYGQLLKLGRLRAVVRAVGGGAEAGSSLTLERAR